MLRRDMLSIILFAAAGCGRRRRDTDRRTLDAPVALQVVNADERSTLDEEVLRVVIEDLLTYRGEDAVVQPPMNHPELMFLDTSFLDHSPTDDAILRQNEPEKWTAIRDIRSSDLRESTDNLRYRAKTAKRYSMKLNDSRILTDLDESKNRYTRPISMYLPGYNSNRDTCVVFMMIPWSIHHADGTFVLQLVEGKWTLRLRQFVVYL